MEQAAALMLIAQAAGLHPAIAARVFRILTIKVLPDPFAYTACKAAMSGSNPIFLRGGN